VDDVLYYDEVVSRLQTRFGPGFRVTADYAASRAPAGAADASSLLRMLMGMSRPSRPSVAHRPVIAVIHASGPIVQEEVDGLLFSEQMTSADDLVALFHRLGDDPRVRAIVLRVDSPGGSALASDMIWHAVRLADRKKPVIASFSDTAASGGYYIGSGARRILAEPGTLTGSIGIFGGKLVLSNLLKKIGVSVAVIQKGGDSGLLSSLEQFTPQQRQKLQELLQDGYQLFLDRVAETRPNMTAQQVDRVAQGRVWTGDQAHHNGLVDELGGLPEAIQVARKAAGIGEGEQVDIEHLPRSRSLAEMLLFGNEGDVQAPDVLNMLRLPPLEGVRGYLGALMALRGEMALCLLPALVSVR
jgi:protease-4